MKLKHNSLPIFRSMLANSRVKGWWVDDYDKNDVILTVYTYKGNKIVLHLSYNKNTRMDELIERNDN